MNLLALDLKESWNSKLRSYVPFDSTAEVVHWDPLDMVMSWKSS